MENLIEVSHLKKHFVVDTQQFKKPEIIHAVKDVSFTIQAGESVGLIGESGSGKSTVANLLLNLLKQSSGSIHLFGTDISKLSKEAMRKNRKDIQIIFQQSNMALDPQMTVEELMSEPLKIHRIVPETEIDEEVARLLRLVELPPSEKKKFITQMSGGQIQRVIIARAIATRPKIIVCDEPVSALDVSVQGQILNLLLSLKKQLNLSYLFISHNIKVVKFICNRIMVMYQGEIIEQGETAQVLSHPQHAHTKALVDALL